MNVPIIQNDLSTPNDHHHHLLKKQQKEDESVLVLDDPVTPVYMPPSPSSNVTPHELPNRHFQQLSGHPVAVVAANEGSELKNALKGDDDDDTCFKVPSEPVDTSKQENNVLEENLDNMSGVSTATTASIASSCCVS